jgi:hypothetical protein
MKSFLSSLRKLDSSTHVHRDRIASNQQFPLFPSLFKKSRLIDKSMKKGLPGISLSLSTSLLTIGTSFVLLTGGLGYSAAPALAEGSRTMYPSGAPGHRANLQQNTDSQLLGGKLKGRTLLKVYANTGEYINVGSSAVGVNFGDIQIFNPGVVTGTLGQEILPATASFQCSTQRASIGNPTIRATVGVINSRTKELAGPDTITNAMTATRGNAISTGYVPCYYRAPQSGVYDVYFVPPTPANGFFTTTGEVNLDLPDNFTNAQGNTVAAWDVTVRSSLTSTSNQDSRLFFYYAYLRHTTNNRYAYFSLYPVTLDGFQYHTNLNGIDPNSWSSFGNRSGFLDSDGVTPLYHDVFGSDDSLSIITVASGNSTASGASIQLPQFPMFFNRPDSTVVSALGIPTSPIKPEVTAFSFAGSVTSSTSSVGAGGTFTFSANVDHSYEIVISRDGVNFDPTNVNNRVLRGLKSPGTHTVTWNGKDNSGVNFPVGTNYQSKIVIRNGEYHFPMADVENSLGGPSITMLNPPGGICPGNDCSKAFYDDRGYKLLNGTTVGTVNATLTGGAAPTINSSGATGFDSTTPQRAFSANFGDKKGLDIWTYFPSEAASTSLDIIQTDYGDAPASYGNASHRLPTTPTIYLGTTVPDGEAGTQLGTDAGATAQGDDTNGVDDENGISSFPTLTAGATTYSIPVANITARGTGTLHAWIDFNKNGTFESGEHTSVAVASNTPAGPLTWNGITAGAAGNTFARFRFTSDSTVIDSTPSGTAADGEVEDYPMTIAAAVRPTASDVPLTCPANTVSIANLHTGATDNAITITYPDAGGGGREMIVKKISGTNGLSISLSPNMYKLVPVSLVSPVGGIWLGKDNGLIRSYVDLDTENYEVSFDGDLTALNMTFSAINGNRDGVEHIKILKVSDAAGNDITSTTNYGFKDGTPPGFGSLKFFTDTKTLEPTTYANVTDGGTYGDANGTISLQNAAGIRRVEFQRLEPGNTGSNYFEKERSNGVGLGPIVYCNTVDYGDAPDGSTGVGTGNYKTTTTDNGPRHTIVSGLKLGTNIDSDSGTLQNSTATADNASGTPNDEDAFTALPNVSTSGTYNLSNIPVTNSVGNATLHAWVDFNKNGRFEASEYTSTAVASGSTSANLSWTVPSGTTAGSTYARFRLTTQALTDTIGTTNEDERSFGLANDGEVEDYGVSIGSKANLLLVKRITSIKSGETVTNYDSFVDDTTSTTAINDNHCNWPTAIGTAGACTNTYTVGAFAPGKVKPGDEIEYTIYYLNAGNNKATARICDRINPNLDFSLQGGNGIGLSKGGAAMLMLTNAADTDNAQLDTPTATNCGNLPNNSGNDVVVVDVGTADAPGIPGNPLMGSTGAGTPTTSYGYIRFKTTVK